MKRARSNPAGDVGDWTDSSSPPLKLTIVGTYQEMPGLCLKLPQAARLFGVSDRICHVVLEELVEAGRLRRMPDGQYALR
jgi:hypothetical protein